MDHPRWLMIAIFALPDAAADDIPKIVKPSLDVLVGMKIRHEMVSLSHHHAKDGPLVGGAPSSLSGGIDKLINTANMRQSGIDIMGGIIASGSIGTK